MVVCPPDLKNLYREGRLVPFIGAGASMSLRWREHGVEKHGPSWTTLVDEAAKIIGFDEPELLRVRGTDLQILEYFRDQRKFGQLVAWLILNLNPPDEAIQDSQIHSALVALERCNLFYTTNYDHFIERSFTLAKRQFRTVAEEGDMGGNWHEAEIIKFHGDINKSDSMVLSESDYENRLKLRTAMDYRFRSDVLGRALLFIGYSFSDWNVSYLFRLVNDEFGKLPSSISGKRAYIVIANPSDFERHLFKTREIEVIAAEGTRLSEDIAELLTEVRR